MRLYTWSIYVVGISILSDRVDEAFRTYATEIRPALSRIPIKAKIVILKLSIYILHKTLQSHLFPLEGSDNKTNIVRLEGKSSSELKLAWVEGGGGATGIGVERIYVQGIVFIDQVEDICRGLERQSI